MIITSEGVKVGHPDLVADAIAANLIADVLESETKKGMTIHTMPHCGIEVYLGKEYCLVGGESSVPISSKVLETSVRKTVTDLGYTDKFLGLNGNTMKISNKIINQSPDINMGTRADQGQHKEIGAGDQGIFFGFACSDTEERLPLPYYLVSKMMREFEDPKYNKIFAPDGKGQLALEYKNEETKDKPKITKVLMSNAINYQCDFEKDLLENIAKNIAFKVLGEHISPNTEFLFNPTGNWDSKNSCSAADSGITGRKLVVQLYGGFPGAQLGGGAIVNKTPEKVDCSGTLAARYVAKNIVFAGLARACSVQLSYAIGIAEPFSIAINTFGTSEFSEAYIIDAVRRGINLTPEGIIKKFDLLNPDIYRRLTKTLFMDQSYPWEQCDVYL